MCPDFTSKKGKSLPKKSLKHYLVLPFTFSSRIPIIGVFSLWPLMFSLSSSSCIECITWVQLDLGPGTGEKRVVVTSQIHRNLRKIFPIIKAHRHHASLALKHLGFAQSTRAVTLGSFRNALLTWSSAVPCSLHWTQTGSGDASTPCSTPWLCLRGGRLFQPSRFLQDECSQPLSGKYVWPCKVQNSSPVLISYLWGWPNPMVFILWVIFPTFAKDKHLTDHLPTVFSWFTMLLAIPYPPLHFSSFSLRFSEATHMCDVKILIQYKGIEKAAS